MSEPLFTLSHIPNSDTHMNGTVWLYNKLIATPAPARTEPDLLALLTQKLDALDALEQRVADLENGAVPPRSRVLSITLTSQMRSRKVCATSATSPTRSNAPLSNSTSPTRSKAL